MTWGANEWGLTSQMATTLILFFTFLIIVWYAWETRKLAKVSSDNLRIATLPGLKCEVTDFNEQIGKGNVVLENLSNKPCFFWLEVRAYQIENENDWTKDSSLLIQLKREVDPLGYYDGSQRRFMQPGDRFIGVFCLGAMCTPLLVGYVVAVETLLWATGDDRVHTKNDSKVLAYGPKRWILRPTQVQHQTRVQLIF